MRLAPTPAVGDQNGMQPSAEPLALRGHRPAMYLSMMSQFDHRFGRRWRHFPRPSMCLAHTDYKIYGHLNQLVIWHV